MHASTRLFQYHTCLHEHACIFWPEPPAAYQHTASATSSATLAGRAPLLMPGIVSRYDFPAHTSDVYHSCEG